MTGFLSLPNDHWLNFFLLKISQPTPHHIALADLEYRKTDTHNNPLPYISWSQVTWGVTD